MAQNEFDRPIIKRKKTVQEAAHHGGAWKVAYADFVTAMMAFFLLMWLLNATTESQKKGLADYFDSRVPISRVSGGGSNAFSGDSITAQDRLAESGSGATAKLLGRALTEGARNADPEGAAAADGRSAFEATSLAAIDAAFKSLSGESDAADPLLQHIRTKVTDEGLVIELLDADGAPLFEPDGSTPTPTLRALIGLVEMATSMVANRVAVTAHGGDGPADDAGWRLSSDRANAARRLLAETGLEPERVARVTGRVEPAEIPEGDAEQANAADRRLDIILLRR